MLDFLWSKPGQPTSEADAAAAKRQVVGGDDSAPAPLEAQTAVPATAGELPAAQQVPTQNEVPATDPPNPPGGPAEFIGSAVYEQDQNAGLTTPSTDQASPSATRLPPAHWTDADPELIRLDGFPKPPPADRPAVQAPAGPQRTDPSAEGLEYESRRPRMPAGRRRGQRLVKSEPGRTTPLTPPQRLLLLDTWRRSGLPAGDFAALVGLSRHTLYAWKKRFDEQGPAGLLETPRGGPKGSRLPELTKRTILMLKQANPEWGCQRISDLLGRGPALPASPGAVARVLHEAGYTLEEVPTRPHPDKVRHFERAQPNQLWQTDLFTFVLKRQNRRVYLVAFMDDHSRFIVGYGLHASQSSALVLEVLRAAMTSYGTPQEILTDNGSQYVTWRGKSVFSKELEKRGIKQIVATPRRPQTLGKVERFWGTLWRECVESAVFIDLGDAQRRIGLFIDHYNFCRTHSGIDGLVPADRFFHAAAEVKQTLAARVAANALELARQGSPKTPFYLTGQVGGQPFSLHAEGDRKILIGAGGTRQEVELVPPMAAPAGTDALPEPICPTAVVSSLAEEGSEEPPAPGMSPLDEGMAQLRAALPGRQELTHE
jgi:transposase InsO family protein